MKFNISYTLRMVPELHNKLLNSHSHVFNDFLSSLISASKEDYQHSRNIITCALSEKPVFKIVPSTKIHMSSRLFTVSQDSSWFNFWVVKNPYLISQYNGIDDQRARMRRLRNALAGNTLFCATRS